MMFIQSSEARQISNKKIYSQKSELIKALRVMNEGLTGINHRTYKSDTKRDRTRCPAEKVFSVSMPQLVHMFYGQLSEFCQKVISVTRS